MGLFFITDAAFRFALFGWVISSNIKFVTSQELCRSAIEIPSSDFGTEISGSTINGTATIEGCGQTESFVKQWYAFEVTADIPSYYTFISCVANNDDTNREIANGVQATCDDQFCSPKWPLSVNPMDLVDYCTTSDNPVVYTFLQQGINNRTKHAYVALGTDETTTGDFTTALVKHQAPENDSCDAAIPLARNTAPMQFTLYNAIPLTGTVCGNSNKASVWFSFEGLQNLNVVIRTCPLGQPFDHDIDVQDSSCTAGSCVVGPVEANPACAGGKQKRLSSRPATYYLAISVLADSARNRGDFTVQVLSANMATDPPSAAPTGAGMDTPAPVGPGESLAPTGVDTPTTDAPTETPESAGSGLSTFAALVVSSVMTLVLNAHL